MRPATRLAAVLSVAALVLLAGPVLAADGGQQIKVRVKRPSGKVRAGEGGDLTIKLKNRERSEQTFTLEVSYDDDYAEVFHEQTITLAAREKMKITVPCNVPDGYSDKKMMVWARAGDGDDDDKVKVKPAPDGPLSGANLERGRDLYLANCASCHGADGDEIRNEDLGHWREAVREGEDDMPRMPGFSDDDLRLMRAYVRGTSGGGTSGVSDEDWLAGKAIFLTNCSACHGTTGRKIVDEDLGDWREAVWEGEDDMPSIPGLSADDIRLAREYALDPDRVVSDPGPDPDPDPNPDPDPDPGPGPVTYNGAVKAIMDTSCVSCHRQGLALGGIALDTFSSAYANRVALVDSVEKNRMPTSSPLSTAAKTTLRDWLDAGAAEK